MSVTLGLDSATNDTVAGTCDAGGEPLGERLVGVDADGRPRHASALLGLIEEVVAEAGGWERIGLIAVGIGPGSFTGARIGVTTARALAQVRELPIAAVRTSAALAAGIGAGEGRLGIAVLDARRGEVFAEPAVRSPSRASAAEVGPVVSAPGALGEAIPGLAGALAAGEGAIRFRSELEAAGAEVPADGDPVHRLSARHVCRLGTAAEAGEPGDVRPLYLRPPDAERWLERD